jgi:8-hydroxy-5-deazaflavin:NADPH oxidoreductase
LSNRGKKRLKPLLQTDKQTDKLKEKATMRIAVIGAGNIGGTLGQKWAGQGHTVVYGVRDPAGVRAELGAEVTAVSPSAAVAQADVVLFAIPGRAVTAVLAEMGDALDGKIIIDATNQVGQPVMHSLDALRQAAPTSPLYRAFSTLGWENFANPVLGGQVVDLFYCGEGDEAANTVVFQLISDIGLNPIYIGGQNQTDILDALTRLWFTLGLQQGRGRQLAFKMLTA